MNIGNVKIATIPISFLPKACNINSANKKSEIIMQIKIINLYRAAFPRTKSKRKYA
jgi:hypothetical protein